MDLKHPLPSGWSYCLNSSYMTSPVLILLHTRNQSTTSQWYYLVHCISNGLEKILSCHGVWGLIFTPRDISTTSLWNIQMRPKCIFGIQDWRPVYEWSCACVGDSCCWGPPDVWGRHDHGQHYWSCSSHRPVFMFMHTQTYPQLNRPVCTHPHARATHNTDTHACREGMGSSSW